ncbi:MAG: DUF4032 domain-containing protein [Fusobacteriota bacterium]
MVNYAEARAEYRKFKKEATGIFGVFSKLDSLESFSEKQKEAEAYSSNNNGIQSVEIKDIVGSVQKYTDFYENFVPKTEIIEDRWCRIYMAFLNNVSLPPVDLYKIKEEYFVYDGNHRISVANYLDFKRIEAEVREFIPSGDTKEDMIYREKIMFEKLTDLSGIFFTETGQYDRLKKEIYDHQEYLKNKELLEVDIKEAAHRWYKCVFKPCIEILEKNKLLPKESKRTTADLYIFFLDHKYFQSELKKEDLGFKYGIIDFINRVKTEDGSKLEEGMKIDNEVEKNLEKLEKVDRRKKADIEMLEKKEIIEKVTDLKFNYDFLIIVEIENYMKKEKIDEFEKGVKVWYENSFLKKLNLLKSKISFLPKKYSDAFFVLEKNKEQLFYSLQNYDGIFKKSQNEERSTIILIADYIIEIFIPIIEILRNNDISKDDFQKVYYGLQESYDYLLNYKEDLTMDDAKDLYFSENKESVKKVRFRKLHEGFLAKFKDTNKDGFIKEKLINRLELDMHDELIFEEIFKVYGQPEEFSTIFKLEKLKKEYKENFKDKNWLRDKVIIDLKKISKSSEFQYLYKTESALKKVDSGKQNWSLLDFYANIISYGEYLKKDILYVDIIDLALEYKIHKLKEMGN